MVTTLTAGTTTIIATSQENGTITGQATLTVLAPVASVTVTLNASTIIVGSTTGAAAVLRDANANILAGRTITWSTSDIAVATVDVSTGLVTGVAPGTADVIATSEGVTGQVTIEVSPVPVASVSVTLNASTIMTGTTTAAIAQTRDASNNVLTGRNVAWSSSDPAIATVDPVTGVVTGVTPGTVNIIGTSESITGQASLEVIPVPVASVTVTLSASTVLAGTSTAATAISRDAASNILTDRPVAWSSSNETVATVDATSGAVTTLTAGATEIIATSEENGTITGQATLTVLAPVASVTVTLSASTVLAGTATAASAVSRDAAQQRPDWPPRDLELEQRRPSRPSTRPRAP